MNPWTQVLDRIWYYLEEGPASGPVAALFPPANRYRCDHPTREPEPPDNDAQPVLMVDQSGGELDVNYSPHYLLAREQYQITIWTGTLALSKANDARLKVLAAVEAGLPNLGLDSVLQVRLRTGRMTPALDRVERDADGRLTPWRWEYEKLRRRSVLLELMVTFLIDRADLAPES